MYFDIIQPTSYIFNYIRILSQDYKRLRKEKKSRRKLKFIFHLRSHCIKTVSIYIFTYNGNSCKQIELNI